MEKEKQADQKEPLEERYESSRRSKVIGCCAIIIIMVFFVAMIIGYPSWFRPYVP